MQDHELVGFRNRPEYLVTHTNPACKQPENLEAQSDALEDRIAALEPEHWCSPRRDEVREIQLLKDHDHNPIRRALYGGEK